MWCWFHVMVGSYCFVGKVSAFNPDSPEKLLKRSVEPDEAPTPQRRWVGLVASLRHKSKPLLLQPSIIITASVCFGGKTKNLLWRVKQGCVRRWIQAHLISSIGAWLCLSVDRHLVMILRCCELHNLNLTRVLSRAGFFCRRSPSHADGMCGFAAI